VNCWTEHLSLYYADNHTCSMYPCTACANYSLDRSLSRVSRPNGPRANNCHGPRLALIRHWSVASLCCTETRPRATLRHGSFLWPILSCIIRRFRYLQNMATSLWNVAAKAQTLDLENFATVDRVVNNTRRRSSLWITLTTVERVVTECMVFTARWSTVTL